MFRSQNPHVSLADLWFNYDFLLESKYSGFIIGNLVVSVGYHHNMTMTQARDKVIITKYGST